LFLPPNFPTALRRGARMLIEPTAPVLVQMVVTRRCNLSCGYCNEYDDVSDPIPSERLKRQIDHVAALGTLVLTFTGGEPLLHPELDQLIAYAVSKGLVVTSITNGYPVTRTWIERLNRAQLSFLQISIDNLEPNDVSQKSLSKIKKKLELLKEHAKFGVNVNAVLGSSPPEATRELVGNVEQLGFFMTVGLMHGPDGQLDAGLEPGLELLPGPVVHADLAAAAALAAAHQQGSATRIQVGLGERERLVDPQAARHNTTMRPQPAAVDVVASAAHDRDALLDRRRVGRVADSLVARRPAGVELRQRGG